MSRFRRPLLVAILLAIVAGPASAQSYPSKPIRIVTVGAGGGLDFASRLIAQELSGGLGPVIVDNRGGAGGMIAIETAAKATPDGYTVLLHGSAVWLLPFMRDSVSWDPVRDFLPVTLVGSAPNVLVVHPSLPVKSVRDLVALAKARPGELDFSSTGGGSVTHIAAELFKAMAGINMVHVPYRSGGLALSAVMSGEIELMFPSTSAATPHIKAGRLRALGLTSERPSEVFPGLTTIAASGLPGYQATSMYGVWTPAKTPSSVVGRLNQEIVKVLAKPDVKARFLSAGLETVGSSPEAFADLIRKDMATLGKLIKDVGIRAQ